MRTPGATSTFDNYTNYVRGLNGVIIDIAGLPAGVTDLQMLASLQFAHWNGIDAGGFTALPRTAMPTVSVLAPLTSNSNSNQPKSSRLDQTDPTLIAPVITSTKPGRIETMNRFSLNQAVAMVAFT